MLDTLEGCLSAAHTVIAKYGNVYMFPDPYSFKVPPKIYNGVALNAISVMVPGLRWSDLIAALGAIEQVMLQRAIYKEAFMKMHDEPSGVEMGVVNLYRSSPMYLVGLT